MTLSKDSKMIRAERETVIVANLADLDAGFFTVETTEKGIVSRLLKLPGISLLSFSGDVYLYKVPANCWKGLSVRAPRVLSPKRLVQLGEMRAKKGHPSNHTP
jgi:hypothetical protein